MDTRGRVVENPVNGEIVTFVKTTDETNGEYLQIEVELKPNGKIPPHFHLDFDEYYKLLEGELNLRVGKEHRVLKPGDEVLVPPKTLHYFWNTSGKNVKFINIFKPAIHFEKAIRVGDGLAYDGLANKKGIPKNIFHLAIIFQWLGSYFPGVPVWLQKAFFGALAKIARKRGIDKELISKYL